MRARDVRLGRDRRTGVFFVAWRDGAGRRCRRSLGTKDPDRARSAVRVAAGAA